MLNHSDAGDLAKHQTLGEKVPISRLERRDVENIILRRSTVLALVGLLLSFALCDVWLLFHSIHQREMIARFANQQANQVPTEGATLPVIKGMSLGSSRPFELGPASSSRFALLIFRESCSFCKANWRNWEKLFGTEDPNISVYLITSDKVVSQSYQDEHPLLQKGRVILGIDPTVLSSLKLGLTPQTIYVVNGRVRQDWPGVLSEKNLAEIRTSLSGR